MRLLRQTAKIPPPMKQVLVTGGAGFIGSHLVDRLIADGHEVRVIDNLSTGHADNLEHHRNQSRLRFVEADIRNIEAIRPQFKGVDWVFHLAALADIVPSIEKPLDYFTTNVTGTAHVLECAREAGVSRLVYAASSSSYGIPDVYPTPETAEIRCEYPYALSKYLGELAILHWAKVYRFPALALKFFNIYGPRVRTTGAYGAVFGVFLAQKANGKPFTVVGDGTQTRDFTFVTDAVDSLVTAAGSGLSGKVLNVGSGGTYSVNRLIELLGGPRVYVPKRPGEPDCTYADITQIRRLLGWEPRVRFEDGVKVMLGEIERWRTAPVWNEATVKEATRNWFKYLGAASVT